MPSLNAVTMGWRYENLTKQNILILCQILTRIESDQK